MTRVLWISDAGRTTGFSTVTHAIGERLADMGHEVHVLAIGYDGKEPYRGPMTLWGATGQTPTAAVGFDRMPEVLNRVNPDVVITLEDIPLVVRRLGHNPHDNGLAREFRPGRFATGPWRRISYVPVDGTGFPPQWRKLNDYVTPVAMTRFGALQVGTPHVIYHGVDTEVFHPVSRKQPIDTGRGRVLRSKRECRDYFGVPDEMFVVGRADTNSGRKDWGSTWRALEHAAPDMPKPLMGMFHTKLINAQNGTNLESLFSRGRVTISVSDRSDFTTGEVAAYVNCWDAALTTSRGEGAGLTNMEALACGVPVVAPRHSAFPEMVGPGGVLVEPATVHTSAYGHDMQVADWRTMAQELVALSRDTERRKSLGLAGLEHIRSNASWDVAAQQFDDLIEARSETQEDAGQDQRTGHVQVRAGNS